ncbi:MAG: pantoate--beta-alanine ligase [Flavobacteriaceae bacterium]
MVKRCKNTDKKADFQQKQIVLLAFNALKMGESHVFTSVESIQTRLRNEPENSTIGFLPTMGALHHGHLALVSQALYETDIVVVSIFVNPTQFNKSEDLENYPRNLDEDLEMINSVGKVLVFAPNVDEVYPIDYEDLTIDLGELGTTMEGEFRPGHFVGVMNVVKRLFDIIRPTKAYFGLKDLQQVAVVQFMVDELSLPVEIVPCEIIREPSGLASSSRNKRLSDEQLEEAVIIIRTLEYARDLAMENGPDETRIRAMEFMKDSNLEIEYLEMVDPKKLKILKAWIPGAMACIVAYNNGVRLLDNLEMIPKEEIT